MALFGLVFLTCGAANAAEIQFEASVDRLRAGRGDPIQLTLAIRSDESLNHVPAPQLVLSDFDVHGPSIATRMEMVNFRTTFTRELTYTLFARRTGKITIGPARLRLEGQTYQTKAIEVEIVQGSTRKAPTPGGQGKAESGIEDNLFVRVGQSHRQLYVGQQLSLDYELCYRFRLYDVGFKEIPAFSGFWSRELFVAQQLQPQRQVIDGVAFNVAPLRRMALFPTAAGTQRIEPLVISCQIPRTGRRRSLLDDFGMGGSLQAVIVRSEAVEVEVLPLPEAGRPAAFAGAVGRFRLDVDAQPRQVPLGDPVTLRVEVAGIGNMETFKPPPFDGLDGFALYEPKVEAEDGQVNGQISGSRVFEYILIPERGGRLEIPAIEMAYFDPEAAAYRLLRSEPIAIESRGQAAAASGTGGMSRQQIQAVGRDIRYIKPDLTVLEGPRHWHRHWAFWGIQLLLPLAFCGLWGWRRFQRRLQGDVAYARRRRASSEAGRHLKEADRLRQQGEGAAFYAEVQRAVLSFLADRLNLAAAGLTADRCEEILRQRQVAEADIDALRQLLARCDFARFAPGSGGAEDMSEVLDTAKGLIERLEGAL